MKIINCKADDVPSKVSDIIEKKIVSIKKENVSIGICGGRSVSAIFSELYTRKIDWKKVHFFLVDERVTKKKDELNFSIAEEYLFNKLLKENKIKKENLHQFSFTGNIQKDMFDYYMTQERISFRFDIVLLSAGEDGHIASLFPNHSSIEDSAMGHIYIKDSPKPPLERVSASRNFIQESDTAILLFLGDGKRDAFKNFKDKKKSVKECPAKIIENIKDSYVFTDL